MTKSIFELDEFKPHQNAFEARRDEFLKRESYFDGSVYSNVHWLVRGLPVALSHGVRALYSPLARAVNVDAGIVPGNWMLTESAQSLQDAVNQVFAWSRWATDGVLFVHFGALYGESVLRVADVRAAGEIRVIPTNPASVLLIASGVYDRACSMALVVETRDDYEYAEVVEPARVRTFKNGEPFGYDKREAEYQNVLGFVSFVSCPHLNNGRSVGDCAFSRAMTLLDEVNGLATDIRQIIGKHMKEPQWGVVGAEAGEVSREGDIWFLPGGGDFKVLVPAVDLAGILMYLDRLSKQLEKSMPELAFDELTSKELVATATVQLQLLELVLLIKRVRPNYDDALTRALRMAGRAARSMGLENLAGLDSDVLAFDARRPVLPIDAVGITPGMVAGSAK